MAAILQLRQGSTSTYISQGANVGEPFFDTGSNILVVGKSSTEVIKLGKLDESNAGSFSITGDLTASNAILSGDITIGGNIILGDAVQDNITISGQFDSDLIPSASGEYDLGSETKKWNNIFVVSGSIDSIDLTSNLPSGTISGSSQLPSGIISGSSQLPSGIISGSEQLPSSIVSSSQQVIDFLPDSVVSGSSQITDGSGLVSSSFQIDAGLVANFDLEVKNKMNLDGVLSGSGQLPDGVISGSQQIIDSLPSGTVSGSQQIISSLPTGTISGSEQLPSGIISGSSQLPSGIISGSSQVIELLPTNTISGSSQISELTHLHSFTSSYNNAISLNGDDVTILGDLVVQGTQTQLNTETLNIEDKNLLIASGAADSSAADGAGITIDGADKSLEWEHGTSQFVFDAQVSSSVGFKGDGSNLTGVTAEEIEYTNILNKPTLVSGSDQVLGGTNIVSSSQQVTDFLPSGTISGSSQVTYLQISSIPDGIVSGSTQIIESLPDGTISGSSQVIESLPDGTISGSSQVTYLDISSKPTGIVSGSSQITNILPSGVVSGSSQIIESLPTDVVSGSSQLQSDYDIRYAPSSSLYTLIGNFPTSGSLGTAAFYNVSSSLADDPNVIPNVKAVFDYINNTIGAADITGVSASLGLSGGGDGGYVSLSLDTASAHFQAGVESYSSTLPDGVVSGSIQIVNVLNGEGVISGSSQVTITESQISDLQSYLLRAPDGTVSGSSQTIDHIEASTLVAINQTSPSSLGANGELIINGSTNAYSGILTLESGSVKVYNQYATESDKMVNFLGGSGYGLFLQPDNTSTKAWVIDTDGDFVSQGTGDVYAENLYSTNAISGSSLSLAGNITLAGTVDGIDIATDVAANTLKTGYSDSLVKTKLNAEQVLSGSLVPQLPTGVISGSSQVTITESQISDLDKYTDADVKIKLDAEGVISGSSQVNADTITNFDSNILAYNDSLGVISGSSQIDVTLTTNYSSINQYTNTDNTTHLNSLGVLSGSTQEGDFTFDDNVIVEGNLTVNGTTTSVNSNTVNIGDNIIVLNSDETGTPSQDAGIEIERGTSTNARIMWDESEDYWSAGLVGAESKIITAGNVDYYTNTDNTTHLNTLGVISGSSQVSLSGFTTNNLSEGADNLYYTNARVKTKLDAEGVLSGSSQVSIGASQVTEISNLTADEGAQLENIDSATISTTQWGYLGGLNQALTTTSDALFNKVQSNNPDLTHGGHVAINSSYDGSGWGTNKGIGRITFGTLDSNSARTVGTIEVKQEDNGSTYPDETYMVFKTTAAADVNAEEKMRLSADGNLTVKGDVVAYSSSDRRLKDEIIPISNPIEKINSIGGYSFVWNSEKQNIYKGKDYGVIAQEIEEVLPELVTTRENGYKAVKYDKIISLLIEGIKELSTEVKELKEKINRE